MIRQATPEQRAALARRYRAAEDLERARQICRENGRYGYATGTDRDNVHQAETAYDQATAAAGQVSAA